MTGAIRNRLPNLLNPRRGAPAVAARDRAEVVKVPPNE